MGKKTSFVRAALIFLACCRAVLADECPATGGPLTVAQAEAAKIFHGVGKITAIDAASGAVTIDHGAIPGLMEAMEMPYQAKPAKLLEGLKPGDKVDFAVDGKSLTIVEVRKK
jgi:Cu/Ag efflux protein CusF